MRTSFPQIKLNLFDRLVLGLNPKRGAERVKAKMAVAALGAAGYIAPGSSKKSTRGWLATANHVDYDTLPVLDSARAGARDLWMNTPIATGALKRCRTNIVGFGLALQSRVDRTYLGLSDEEADAWERNTEREFKVWAASVDCDIRRKQNFAELQALSLMATLMSGDCFVLLPMVPRKGQPYDLRVHIVEADYCSNPVQRIETLGFSGGVECDTYGAPVAYHFQALSPDQSIYSITTQNGFGIGKSWERVLAYGPKSGRRNVLHLMDVERPGQRRGMPFLAPVLETLKQLTRLSEAELAAAVVSSFFTVFVKNVPGNAALGAQFTDENSVLNPNSAQDANMYEMASANVIKLDKDEDIVIADPKRPNALFEPFFTAILKQVGSALEIPFEQLLLHFSASYSASRAALLEAWKFYRKWRVWMGANFCSPVYEEWLTEAILKGRTQAPGFFDDPRMRAAWAGSEWAGAGQGQIDPLKETQAAALRVEKAFSTREEETFALSGQPWEGKLNRLAREQKAMIAKGLMIDPIEMALAKQGQAQPGTSNDLDDEGDNAG